MSDEVTKPEKNECEHEWKTEIMFVRPSERTNRQLAMGMEYRGGRAAFKIRRCIKCNDIIYVDYKVER